ncbi:MAG: dTDP-4-dehydrorhamnose 3,5-epimerase family protein [Rhizomicrobium sp.]
MRFPGSWRRSAPGADASSPQSRTSPFSRTMRFTPTDLDGAVIVELDGHADARGYFARSFCEEEFGRAGIAMRVVQTNISRNPRKGTLRGMHYQSDPFGEAKIVQCVRGAIFDVAVDLRPRSPTYRRWAAVELSAEGNRLFIFRPAAPTVSLRSMRIATSSI